MLTIKAVQPHSPELVDFLALPQKLYGKGHNLVLFLRSIVIFWIFLWLSWPIRRIS